MTLRDGNGTVAAMGVEVSLVAAFVAGALSISSPCVLPLVPIYLAHLATPDAQDELETLAELVRSGRRVCLLCLEANPMHCHRSMVATALADLLPLEVTHLFAEDRSEA